MILGNNLNTLYKLDLNLEPVKFKVYIIYFRFF